MSGWQSNNPHGRQFINWPHKAHAQWWSHIVAVIVAAHGLVILAVRWHVRLRCGWLSLVSVVTDSDCRCSVTARTVPQHRFPSSLLVRIELTHANRREIIQWGQLINDNSHLPQYFITYTRWAKILNCLTQCFILTPKHWGKWRLLGEGCRMRPEGPKIEAEGRERGEFLGWGSKHHQPHSKFSIFVINK